MAVRKKPKTKLNFDDLRGDLSVGEVAKEMGLAFYTQLYQYQKKGANPTLLMMEQIVEALSKLHKRKISIMDLLEERPPKEQNQRRSK